MTSWQSRPPGAAGAELGGVGALRCLLLSPVAPQDPDNGDAQFTRDLLSSPPDGVDLIPYTDALASGEISWGPSVRSARQWRRPLADPLGAIARAGLHAFRHSGALLPDPVRWLRILGTFDVVHVHCLPVRFLGDAPPVVVSDSAGTYWYWTAARGMDGDKVERLLRRERLCARTLGYLHPSAHPEGAARSLLFVDAGRALQQRVGVDTTSTLRCPPGVPAPVRPAEDAGKRLLFVARDFQTKGGDLAVEVLRQVRGSHPDATLLVAGSPEPDPGIEGVRWLGPRSRDELYRDVYPQADLFVYPTRFDCAPLVVMEALAHGIPVVAPSAFAIPELVVDGVTGILHEPGDVAAAAAAVEALLDEPTRRVSMGAAARADYQARFSVEHRNQILATVYREVVER
ncbi:MAG: glycosyltransferase family 4 protein [Actinobacteria bacterium]|nr:glycosyltransferase family 4 protein [Actinomycetota bacterium]